MDTRNISTIVLLMTTDEKTINVFASDLDYKKGIAF